MLNVLKERLSQLCDRQEEVSALLSDPEIMGDRDKFTALSREYAELTPVVEANESWASALQEHEDLKEMLSDSDPEVREMAELELDGFLDKVEQLETDLTLLLTPKDEDDRRNVFLEVRAGTGGDEAALFSGDLLRMYERFAELKKWQVSPVSASPSSLGGYKEVIVKVEGDDVYGTLKFESGAHRVQRVPDTESQGRIHTSACTVAVLPVVEEDDAIEIAKEDLRVDTFRASGAGGQHVNTTDSAVRITHLPTGLVVECQDERSQHKNKAKAMALLSTRLRDAQQQARQQASAETRKSLVGSGDRSERIRTYNFPQGRLTDHRINLTLYRLDEIMQGDLFAVVEPLQQADRAESLSRLASENA